MFNDALSFLIGWSENDGQERPCTGAHPPARGASGAGSGLKPGSGLGLAHRPRSKVATKSRGLQGRGVLGTRDWRVASRLPSCTGAPATYPEGEAETGYMVGLWRCRCGQWVLLSGEEVWAGPWGVGAALR